MTPDQYISLFEKFQAGNCTIAEIKLLQEYRDNFELTEREWVDGMGEREEIRSAIYSKLQDSMVELPAPVKKNKPLWRWVSIAAAVIAVVSVSLLFHKDKESKPLLANNNKPKVDNRILPGSNKAILTLANGSKVILGNSGTGTLARQGQTTINKINNGQLVYNSNNKQPQGEVLYNMATTPKGGQYQLVLSDGTKVWLNAASSIKFPVTFAGKERHVELSGEAYFEVAKNKNMPFTVGVKGSSIEVLGTHFNVMAYDDESHLVTTLLEGSVKLKKNGAEALLKPGQQADLLNGQAAYKISEVNTDEAVAWKNGYFLFDNENIQSIMKKVSRWYDVDVTYKGAQADQDFGGTLSRFSKVTDVLKMLELTGTVHFKVEGRMITVMP